MTDIGADTCRQAAGSIRNLATAATPGPWASLENGDRLIHEHDDGTDDFTYVVDEPMGNGANAAYIAACHPLVMLDVAVLLDLAADDFELAEAINSHDPDNPYKTRVMHHPLAVAAFKVARAFLGDADA